ncbi:MAG: IS630 family transposase [Thermoplasmata archaeon]
MRVAPPVLLTPEERAQLVAWSHGRAVPHRLVLRSRLVLRAADGAQDKQIAAELRTTRITAALWRRRFLTSRVQGLLADAPRPGGPPSLSEAKIRAIVRDTLHTKPPNATHWSTRTMAERHRVSPMTVQRIWLARRLQPHRLEHFKLSRDHHFEEKLRDVVGLYLHPPEHALVLSVDEKTGIQALNRTQTILPLRPGLPERQTHDYRRNGRMDLFAALNVLEGKVIGECYKRHRAKEFLSFLRTIDRSTPPELDLHLVLDNLSVHKTPEVKEWTLRHPRFHFHFVPTGSSWLNQVEPWFNQLTQKRIRRGTFRSEAELCQALYAYIENWNERAGPFQWTATPEAILEKIARVRLSIDGSVTRH